MIEKQELRSNMKERLALLSDDTYEIYSELIRNKLINQPAWKKAETIGMTISRGREVETKKIIEAGWLDGKKIAVPKCLPRTREMDFRLITSFHQIEDSYFGLQEPIIDSTEQIAHTDLDLLLVPGLIFDLEGYRTGFGGGYYDRYLTKYNGPTLSIAFHFQVIDKVPRESFDKPVDMIITDQRIFEMK
ncbi:5-formyltetrahydrofolate cyclo-ligase [Anaerobacillus sp. MEB173]|uniref:5-formyltetrahydrofolate cyclo-ligase n=1 Tax=Anaerobacillus sp. MEB173 TaxID=3383345 RepID=UPI003F93D5F2